MLWVQFVLSPIEADGHLVGLFPPPHGRHYLTFRIQTENFTCQFYRWTQTHLLSLLHSLLRTHHHLNEQTTGEFTSTELWVHFVHHTLTRTCSSLRKRLPAPHTFKICCSFNQIGVGDHHDAVTTQRRTRGAVEVTCLLSDTSVSSGCSLVQAVVSSGCSLRCCCCF